MKSIFYLSIKWLDIVNYLGIVLFGIYFSCMFVYPFWFEGNWWYAQRVWNSWQPLNASMLAFFSAIIAINITKNNERKKRRREQKQRERNFEAAKAFLPHVLSELIVYTKSCAALLKESIFLVNNNSEKGNLNLQLPILPTSYQEIFKDCIKNAEPKVAKNLAYLLNKLQIQNSRITGLYESFADKNSIRIKFKDNLTILGHIYDLCEIYALFYKAFEFARGISQFPEKDLVIGDFCNALFNLEITEVNYEDLNKIIEGRLENHR